MLPTDLATVLRRKLDGCDGLKVGLEAVAVGTLLALVQRDSADRAGGTHLCPTSPGATRI